MYHNNTTWLDRFCAKHRNFGIPNLMLYIVIGNVAVCLLSMFSMGGGASLYNLLSFSAERILHGEIWRLITFVFVPQNTGLFFVAISSYFYYWIGSMLEREWGTGKFTMFYLCGLVLNILVGFIVGGASIHYINLSLFFAFATLYGEMQVLLFFIIPIKIKWLAWLDAALFGWEILRYLISGNYLMALLPVVAILNFLLFFWRDFMGLFQRVKRRTSPNVVNFKKAQKQAQKKAKETGGFAHKCAVCGITDADNPDTEFRYCSKCDGYFCYCMDHINNHVHVHNP